MEIYVTNLQMATAGFQPTDICRASGCLLSWPATFYRDTVQDLGHNPVHWPLWFGLLVMAGGAIIIYRILRADI